MTARIDEIAPDLYRISLYVPAFDLQFNHFLVKDEEPLLFHTGPRGLFPLVAEAVAKVLPVESLRWITFGHVEADECGSINPLLHAAPQAVPLCSQVAAMVSMNDLADRPPRALADGERLLLGRHEVQWFDAPHVPHGWECGFLMDRTTRTLFCGDLFTQPGEGTEPLTEADILGPSEAFRAPMDYYAHAPHTGAVLQRLAAEQPRTLACMHGSAWRGDGGRLLRHLAEAVVR